LATYPWPGNIRELRNFVEKMVVVADRFPITSADVERERQRSQRPSGQMSIAVPGAPPPPRKLDREAVEKALRDAHNNRTVAARLLDVSRRTLYNKLEEFSLL